MTAIPDNDNPLGANHLTDEQKAVYQAAINEVGDFLKRNEGQPCAILSACGLLLLEKYMQLANTPDLIGVAEVLDKMANDMRQLGEAMHRIKTGPAPKLEG